MRPDHETVYAAYCALLALPDEPLMPTRGRHYTQPGDARRRDVLKRDLERAWVRWRMHDAGRDDSAIVCVRRGMGAYQMRKRA